MPFQLSIAPCCWGVDDPDREGLPDWRQVVTEAGLAGYRWMELGPTGYLPAESPELADLMREHDLSPVAGTVFDDLVTISNRDALIGHTRRTCADLVRLRRETRMSTAMPLYYVIIDWGHEARDYAAGHPDRARRLDIADHVGMIETIRTLARIAWEEYGIRPVIHPHAGGHVEFEDEIERVLSEIPQEVAGLAFDTGHTAYAGMDPARMIAQWGQRIDYVHVKDIDGAVFRNVMKRHIRFFDACAEGVMCPIGRGMLDYEAIRDALLRTGYDGAVTIEQERDPASSGSSLEDVTGSRVYLENLGFGNEERSDASRAVMKQAPGRMIK
ncbi:TIM barrel protein [Swaminathania salitolerans]|uniref:Xylose isomerase-like TIM barrel domain-containing protein n=1 Tax=Swaminathania salitolerans TaxID=182838 RepID=A0A511BMW6_9PROT|nr:TIM barrel protein [Swaminathania salitolerans]GBQ13957.1 hypothetical protein AA21291_1677 [Swaminathania salitolerans LMG 21291]GEL01680.1 hypothetical protein SSA02_08430 [Swaminathania salitolerans]